MCWTLYLFGTAVVVVVVVVVGGRLRAFWHFENFGNFDAFCNVFGRFWNVGPIAPSVPNLYFQPSAGACVVHFTVNNVVFKRLAPRFSGER